MPQQDYPKPTTGDAESNELSLVENINKNHEQDKEPFPHYFFPIPLWHELNACLSEQSKTDVASLKALAHSCKFFNDSGAPFIRIEEEKIASKNLCLLVASGDLDNAVKIATLNPNLLLYSHTVSTESQNDIKFSGTPLEIALKGWDFSPCVNGKKEMVEHIIQLMKALPHGETLIANAFKKLIPEGFSVLKDKQLTDALTFRRQVLEPLSETLRTANHGEITILAGLNTCRIEEEIPDYIYRQLINTALWPQLLEHAAQIKRFVNNDDVYNPYYLTQAFDLVLKAEWARTQSKLNNPFIHKLLAVTVIGFTQAASPASVNMVIARDALSNFYYNKDQRTLMEYQANRNLDFKVQEKLAIFDKWNNILRLGIQFWASSFAVLDEPDCDNKNEWDNYCSLKQAALQSLVQNHCEPSIKPCI